MQVSDYVTVACGASHCPETAERRVPRERVAPGVLAAPRLLCETCGCDMRTITEGLPPDESFREFLATGKGGRPLSEKATATDIEGLSA